jgi:hypothetical protein
MNALFPFASAILATPGEDYGIAQFHVAVFL